MELSNWDSQKTIHLVHASQRGNKDALNDLFARYLPRVRQIVAVRTGHSLRQLEEIDDIVQEALLKVFQGLNRFDQRTEGSFRNWVAHCVECEIIDLKRRNQAQKRGGGRVRRLADLGGDTLSLSIFGSTSPTPSQIASAKELEEKIAAAIRQLPKHHREVICLRSLCEMSFEEVAQAMGFEQEATARKAFSRAMIKLTELVGLPA